MYEELIQDLRDKAEFLRKASRYSSTHNSFAETMSQAADTIEEEDMAFRHLERDYKALCAYLPKWIPATERLPEKDIEVLVFAEGKIEGFFGDTVIAISKRYDFKIFTDSEGVEVWQSPCQYFLTDYEITHWMPLPSAPTEE